jgi:hypothetical protein
MQPLLFVGHFSPPIEIFPDHNVLGKVYRDNNKPKTTDSNIKMLPDISFVRLLFDATRDKRFSSCVVYHRDKLNTFFYPSSFSTKTGVSQLLLSFVKSND